MIQTNFYFSITETA